MKEILKVSCNDKEFNIKLEGENIDLYTVIADIIKEISRQRGVTTDTSIKIIKKMIEDNK